MEFFKLKTKAKYLFIIIRRDFSKYQLTAQLF